MSHVFTVKGMASIIFTTTPAYYSYLAKTIEIHFQETESVFKCYETNLEPNSGVFTLFDTVSE